MTSTILVSGVSGVVGYGILRSLRRSHPECRLIGTTIHVHSVARAFCDISEIAPATSDPGYMSWMLDLIAKYDVSLAIPGIEVDVVAWSENKEFIEQAGAKVLLNNSELIGLCADKWLFYQRLTESHSPYAIPTSLKFDEKRHAFPLLLKPRRGSGSKGIVIVQNRAQLDEHQCEIGSNLMIQPIIGTPDEEYTTSAFFDSNSRLCASMTLRRTLSQQGFTETAETVEREEVGHALVNLAEIFRPIGPTNFQFRVDQAQWKILEINPRISSATSIRMAFGYNESAMGLEFFLKNNTPKQPVLKHGRAVRYTEDVIYYDGPDI